MGKKKQPEKAPNHERWLVSYADFITLLFAVFVVLYAMSQTDQKKVEQVIKSLRESFGLVGQGVSPVNQGAGVLPLMNVSTEDVPVEDGTRRREFAMDKDLVELQAKIETWLESAGLRGMSAEITRRGLVISLEGTSFFRSGSAQLLPEAYPLLDRIAQLLAPFDNPIRVEGFTDSFATSNYPSNWELSANRAAAVVRHLMARGLQPGHLAATGYGEHYPVADNGTEEGRRRNRRVDIVLLARPDASTSL